MKNKNILILGSTGFIGRSLTKKLLSKGHLVISPVRNPDKVKRNVLSGTIGQIKVVPFDISNISSLEEDIKKSDVIINLLGILFEKKNNSFELVHYFVPKIISDLCFAHNKKFIHISSLGSTLKSKSSYIYSKALGEQYVQDHNDNFTIIKPSIVFGEEDNFLNQFGQIIKLFSFVPLYKKGQTKFQPIYVDDLTLMIEKIASSKDDQFKNSTISAVGNSVYSFRDILEIIFEILQKKKRFIKIPDFIASIQGRLMQNLPRPLFTYDQFLSLSHDSTDLGAEKKIKEIIGRDLTSMKLKSSDYLKKFIDKV